MENRKRVRKSVPWTSEFSVSFYRAVSRRQRQQQSADRNRNDSQVYVLRDGRLVGGGGGSRQHLSTNLAMATIWNTSKPMWADRGRGRRRFSWSRSVVVVAGGQSRWTACAVAHIMLRRWTCRRCCCCCCYCYCYCCCCCCCCGCFFFPSSRRRRRRLPLLLWQRMRHAAGGRF